MISVREVHIEADHKDLWGPAGVVLSPRTPTRKRVRAACIVHGRVAAISIHGNAAIKPRKKSWRLRTSSGQIVLRSGNMDSWASSCKTRVGPGRFHIASGATYVRDAWVASTLKDLGHIVPSSEWWLLTIGDHPLGLYHAIRRPNRQWAQDVIGKDATTVRPGQSIGTVIQRGRWDLWHPVRNCTSLVILSELMDVDRLAEYLIVNQWSANWDWPRSNWVFAGSKSQRLVPVTWDAEATLGDVEDISSLARYSGDGLAALWDKLREWPDFRKLYLATVDRLMTGELSPDSCASRWQLLCDQVEPALEQESRIWGTATQASPLTVNGHWRPAVERIRDEWFPRRAGCFLSILRQTKIA